jgi:yeast amino acid transporter
MPDTRFAKVHSGEIIAVCAGEAVNPREAVKKSVQPLFWRMGAFFVVNIWLVGMCVSPDNPKLLTESGTMKSPFVLAILDAGYAWLAHLLNAFILLTVVSCGITSVYIASRSLAACSELGLLHSYFQKNDSRDRPLPALVVTILLGCGLSYLNCSETGTVVYGWFSSLVRPPTPSTCARFYGDDLIGGNPRFPHGVDHFYLTYLLSTRVDGPGNRSQNSSLP